MADFTLALEWSDNEDFSDSDTGTWAVIIATAYRQPVTGTRVVWARRGVNTTDFDRMMSVTFDHFGVEGDGPYSQDFGDLQLLETAIFAPYIRIIATGTSLPRTLSGSAFWPTFVGSGLPVTRESYSPSPAPDAGADVATVTFRAVEPNT
jgi:hypothetical protein